MTGQRMLIVLSVSSPLFVLFSPPLLSSVFVRLSLLMHLMLLCLSPVAAGFGFTADIQQELKRLRESQEQMAAEMKKMKMTEGPLIHRCVCVCIGGRSYTYSPLLKPPLCACAFVFLLFSISGTTSSSPSAYLSPTERWRSFINGNDPEDGIERNWLPPSAGRMSCGAAEVRLTQWFADLKDKKEDRDQHPVFHELLRLSLPATAGAGDLSAGKNKCAPLHLAGAGRIIHCINTAYLSGVSPDFSLFPSGYSRSAVACVFNIELQLGGLDPEHKFRAIDYNDRVMRANPARFFTLTAVTNLKDIMFVRTSRVE
jgi:hypothetical protein